jgi:glycosyltransferase involved in cell wall biosynthesis
MRIAHVTPIFPPYRGGMGTVAFHQTQALSEHGAEVTVFLPRRSARPTRPRGVEVVELRPIATKGNAASLPAVLGRTTGYDLIHLHYPFFGTAELLAARRLSGSLPPIVLQYHMDVVDHGWRAAFFRWHRRLFLPLILRAADGIVVTSLDYAASSFLAPRLPLLHQRLATIPGGVDLTCFSPEGGPALGAANDAARPSTGSGRAEESDRGRGEEIGSGQVGRPLIFFLAALDRAHYFKGLHVLLDAMRRLPDAALIVGGDGDLRRHYEARLASLGVSDRVQFVGDIPDQVLPEYYRAADVVALPSIDRTEAFGLVLLEAMACGTPVVASRLPGVRTLVDEGRTGYLAEPGNAADLADKIARCASEGQTLGTNGRRLVEDRFGWKAIGRQLLTQYEAVLSRARATTARREPHRDAA